MASKYNINKGAFAFSLLELVISVGILTTGIIVVMQALSYSAYITGLSADIVKAVQLAQDKLQELEFKEKQNQLKDTPKEDSSGRIEKFQWKYNLNFEDNLKLYKLNLDISWNRKNRKEEIRFNTYLR